MLQWYKALEGESKFFGYLLSPPDLRILFGGIIALSLLSGILSSFITENAWFEGLIFIACSSFIATCCNSFIHRIKIGTALMVSFISSIFLSLFLIFGSIPLIFSLVLLFVYQHGLYTVLLSEQPHRTFPQATYQSLSGILLIFLFHPDLLFIFPKILLSLLALILSGSIFFLLINSSMKKMLGFELKDITRYYVDYLSGKKVEIRRIIEGEEMKAKVDILAFKSKERVKVILLSSEIHPGLMRGVGSFDYPRRVSELSDLPVIVLKGASNHQQDPLEDVSEEISRIMKKEMKNMKFFREVTDPASWEYGNAKVCVQILGDTAFLLSTFAPYPTDDVDVKICEELREMAKNMGLKLFYVECHNSHGTDAMVSPGTKKADEILSASKVALKASLAQEKKKLRIGISRRQNLSLLYMETYPDGIRQVYVILDENNIESDAREKIFEILGVEAKGEKIEVLTSDCHRNIDLSHIHHPMRVEDVARQKKVLRELWNEALKNLEDVEFGYSSFSMEVKVLGTKILKMQEYARDQIRIGKKFYSPMILGAHLLAVLIFLV